MDPGPSPALGIHGLAVVYRPPKSGLSPGSIRTGLLCSEAPRLMGLKSRTKKWTPVSAAEKAFFAPTILPLILRSWVETVKTRIPTEARMKMASRAAMRAKPFSPKNTPWGYDPSNSWTSYSSSKANFLSWYPPPEFLGRKGPRSFFPV